MYVFQACRIWWIVEFSDYWAKGVDVDRPYLQLHSDDIIAVGML